MVSHFNNTPLNGSMFIFGVIKVLKKVGNVAEDGERQPKLINVAFLSVVVVVRDIHANYSLVEQVREQQVPEAAACKWG